MRATPGGRRRNQLHSGIERLEGRENVSPEINCDEIWHSIDLWKLKNFRGSMESDSIDSRKLSDISALVNQSSLTPSIRVSERPAGYYT